MWFLFRKKVKTDSIRYGAYTDPGRREGSNQDAFYAVRKDDFAVFCIADGMGGHSKGEIASAEVVSSVRNWVSSVSAPYSGGANTMFDDLEKAIEHANSVINENYNQNSICGSTVVALLICDGKFCVISVGDSRVYRKDKKDMQQITKDDVFQNPLPDPGFDVNNGKLLKAVGSSPDLICNRVSGKVKKGDVFFLCTDGIYKVVGDEYINQIPEMLQRAVTDEDVKIVLDKVHEQVNLGGARDNNTGIIVKFL